jgi:hypothetical protein
MILTTGVLALLDIAARVTSGAVTAAVNRSLPF